MPKQRFVFVVQGEGRGHLTQAITLYELLTANGHTVSAVLIGSGKGKDLPSFVRQRIEAPILLFPSPVFKKDKNNFSISVCKTFFHTLFNARQYFKSIQLLDQIINKYEPDVIINFYDPLVGIASWLKGWTTKILSIAHQYLYLHSEFRFPPNSSRKNQKILKAYTRFTAFRSNQLLALSFYPVKILKEGKLNVCPPLIRKEILYRGNNYNGKHILVYLVNAGYMKEVIEWHQLNPEVEIHCFTDAVSVKEKWEYQKKLFFHPLDDRKFLHYMAGAAALATTAGFETVCEAMYCGKPVLMVPVKNHFEQWCNARDAAKVGAGIYADHFDLTLLKDFIPLYQSSSAQHKSWMMQAEQVVLNTIHNLQLPTYNLPNPNSDYLPLPFSAYDQIVQD